MKKIIIIIVSIVGAIGLFLSGFFLGHNAEEIQYTYGNSMTQELYGCPFANKKKLKFNKERKRTLFN